VVEVTDCDPVSCYGCQMDDTSCSVIGDMTVFLAIVAPGLKSLKYFCALVYMCHCNITDCSLVCIYNEKSSLSEFLNGKVHIVGIIRVFSCTVSLSDLCVALG